MPETLSEHGTIISGTIRSPISPDRPDFFLELRNDHGASIIAYFSHDEFLEVVAGLNKMIWECRADPARRPWWRFWKRGR